MGNPGAGKSTLCNALMGKALFKAGIPDDGKGVTILFESKKTPHGFEIYDSPGLDDIEYREKASDEITKGLRKGG